MKRAATPLPEIIESDDRFDSTGKHRFWLKAVWNREKPVAVFLMLNPSVGNKLEFDTTINRSISKAHNNGYGSLEIVNLYSYVTSSPAELWKVKNTGGNVLHPENDQHLRETCERGDVVVVATGEKADWPRLREVLSLLERIGKSAKYLGRTKSGFPRHPLYVSNEVRFVDFEIALNNVAPAPHNPPLAADEPATYPVRMTTTLSQSQADLPRLVELASQGEDVVITVEGKPKAKLTRAGCANGHQLSPQELQTWLAELADLRARLATGKNGPSAEQLIAEDREDRV